MAKIKLPFTLDRPSSTEFAVGTDAIGHKNESLYNYLERAITSAADIITGYYHEGDFYSSQNYLDNFKITGQTGKLYIDTATNISYIWSGSEYSKILPALGETSSTAFRGDYGKEAYEHAKELENLSTEITKGLYKISITEKGHISSYSSLETSDLTALNLVDKNTIDEIKTAIGLTDDNKYNPGQSQEYIKDANSIAEALTSLNDSLEDISDVVNIEKISWNNLKTLRDSGQLIPRKLYRITDYTGTTVSSGSRSAQNFFDLLIRADSNNRFNHNCIAIEHEGSTYFNNSNLSKWIIKYDFDNNSDLYSWADSVNGKGVIYYMKDEYDNEASYDFKNIQFEYEGSYYYTFSFISAGNITDFSLNGKCSSNKIISTTVIKGLLGNIFFNDVSSNSIYNNTIFGSNNTFNCKTVSNNIISPLCNNNKFLGEFCNNNNLTGVINGCTIYEFTENNIPGHMINSIIRMTDCNIPGTINGVEFKNSVSNSEISGTIVRDTDPDPTATTIFYGEIKSSVISGYIRNSSFKKINTSHLTSYINKLVINCNINYSNIAGYIIDSTISVVKNSVLGDLNHATINGYLGNSSIISTNDSINYLKNFGYIIDTLITTRGVYNLNNLGIIKGCVFNASEISELNNFGLLENVGIYTAIKNLDNNGTYINVNFISDDSTKKIDSINYCSLDGFWKYVKVNIYAENEGFGLFNYDLKGIITGESTTYKTINPQIRELTSNVPVSRIIDICTSGDIVDYCLADIFALLSDNVIIN